MNAALPVGHPPAAAARARGEVVGGDRHLAEAAGDVEHIARHRGAAQVPAQPGHQCPALGDRGAEMRGAAGEVAMMQVIGLHPVVLQHAEQADQRLVGVVHPAQQHRLRQHRHAAVDEPGDRRARFGREFLRVVGVQHHPDRGAQAREQRHQTGVDAFGCDHRHPGVDAQRGDMGDRVEPGQHVGQAPVRERERVAPGQDHLADRRGGGDIGQRLRQRLLGQRAGLAHRLAAEAEAAIDVAGLGDVQDHPVGIAVRHPGGGRMRAVADRVDQFLGADFKLFRRGHELRGDRVRGVATGDRGTHRRGHADAEVLRDFLQRRQRGMGDQPLGQKVLGVGERVSDRAFVCHLRAATPATGLRQAAFS
ncbi:hypothetical protein SDC9_12973 [bioreactor metagenome]|uniref:Uncharacterized protein n=1 Tax=bioreactor metagenome TaxID=1076179 RepID=A0A644TLT1_9ZZZZ